MHVRIFRRTRNATQSGRGGVGTWVIQPLLPTARRPESLMGWSASGDTLSSLRLTFASYEQAADFAQKQGWVASVEPPQDRIVVARNYADNFKARLTENV